MPASNPEVVPSGRAFFVLGAQKAGTTSLFTWLSKHPELAVHPSKELSFFSSPNRCHTREGFFQCYGAKSRRKICVDISTDYTKYPLIADVPERMYRAFPEARLLYIVRDPVRRAISHYHHQLIIGEERNLDVDSALRTDPCYRYFSLYYLQLTQYLKFFSADQVMVVCLEHLLTSPQFEWRRVLTHAGVRFIGRMPDVGVAVNKSTHAPVITPLIRRLTSTRVYEQVRFLLPRVLRRKALRLLAGKRPPLNFPSEATIDWLWSEFQADSAALVRHCDWKESPWQHS